MLRLGPILEGENKNATLRVHKSYSITGHFQIRGCKYLESLQSGGMAYKRKPGQQKQPSGLQGIW